MEFYEELVYNKYSRNKEGGKRERRVLLNFEFRVFAPEFADANSHSERRTYMPNIKPVSDLRNYNEVLRDIAVGEPVFLTKNGRGRYAIVDMEEFEKTQATLKLMSELAKGEASAKEKGYIAISEVEALLGIKA